MCTNNKSKDEPRLWVGITKLDLLNPAIDAIDLLKGRRLFVLQLNNTTHLATIAKVFDSMAKRDMMSVNFQSETLRHVGAYTLFCGILEDSFLRKLDFEITQVQKIADALYAWIVALAPNQAENIRLQHICIQNEVIHTTGNYNDKPHKQALIEDQKKRWNYLKLVIYNFPPTKYISTISATLTNRTSVLP